MFKKLPVFLFLLLPFVALSQSGRLMRPGASKTASDTTSRGKVRPDMKATTAADTIATIAMYKIITLQRDTIAIDTALTIQKEYATNYLRRDNFGLLPLPNDGQSYNTLDFGLTKFDPFPSFGFKAKHFAYMDAEDVNYYSVATPYTDLMYRSTQSQGQILDALIAVNTSENLNLFVGYKGLRSIGKYINSISSNGVFRLGGSYNTTSKRYFLKFHFTGQDFSNEENGGIVDTSLFESGENPYTNRERLEVYFNDAKSLLKGNRYFIDHTFRLSKTNPNSIVLHHQFNFENKFFEFTQPTLSDRFGSAYTTSINNKTRYNRMYNLVGAAYSNQTVGDIEFYVENYNYNYFYRTVIYNNNPKPRIPNSISDEIYNYGAKYTYHKDKWYGTALVSNSITNQSLSNIDLQARYKFDERNVISAKYQNMNKLPDLNYNLYQSDYKEYNWSYNNKNEKINSFEFDAKTQWLDASLQYTILKDHLYFKDQFIPTAPDTILNVKPFQYAGTINYLSLKAHREFKFWKLGFDNTVLYQNVQQGEGVLNVPSFVTRNTLYYSDLWFKKALFIQTGVTFQYFSKYYANDYNPLIGEFYSQTDKKIGGFPLMDFFINLKIQEFKLFVKAEHFNSSMSGYNFYSAPNYPYRDFTVRFGIIWNFFS
ncbi:putative porin [Flavobacterium psychrotrophum]|uniref:putative porin n=1 Tax=Flavobacterium psychrotrophum TaxID=2294119 RepID=UPI000E31F5C3|nr:putative porin [Flavobacterium psychrotrophum]